MLYPAFYLLIPHLPLTFHSLSSFFQATAWPMEMPIPGSTFHLALSFLGVASAASFAFLLGKRLQNIIRPETVLFSCGLLLLFSELYKQGFLYVVIHQKHYHWWYFPFQLCSIPMYLCLLYPFVHRFPSPAAIAVPSPCCGCPCRAAITTPSQHFIIFSCKAITTFLQDFSLLGGIMALIVPDGFLWPYWTLTLHGFFWHFMLIFISLYCHFCGLSSYGLSGFIHALSLYALCCIIASFINTGIQLFIYPESYADMFYINCFFPSEQPVFHEISKVLGNPWGHFAYILATCCGAWLIDCCFTFLRLLSSRQSAPQLSLRKKT